VWKVSVKSLYLDKVDARICFHDLVGGEPALVFIHGIGSASSADFPAIVRAPELARYRAILIDLLGFGFSDRPSEFSYTLEAHARTVADVLDHLALTNCRVVGHSLGGSIAIVLAAARPDLVGHLIVAEPNLEPEDATLSGEIAEQSDKEYIDTGHAVLIENAKTWAADDPDVASYPNTLLVSDPQAMHRSASSLVAASLTSTFFGLEMPRNYIFGELTLPHWHEELLRARGVPIEIIPNVGHAMMDANPEGVAHAIAGRLP
jgi:pimeloyl-ACP methyl ester carboxylesterase